MARSIGKLLDIFEPILNRAFLSSIYDITKSAQIGQIIKALESRDVAGALSQIYIDKGAFREVENTLYQGFEAAGVESIAGFGQPYDLNGNRFVIRFNSRNRRAESYIAGQVRELDKRILNGQHSSITKALLDGMTAGKNPRSVALDIVGRIDRATGRRLGGVVGLSAPQANAVQAARLELLEGDYNSFLSRAVRDQRFDRTLKGAIDTGSKISVAQQNRIIGRYADSLLKLRGETIARTEMLTALHAGQDEAVKQLLDTDKVTANQVKRKWVSAGDGKVRDTHSKLNGTKVAVGEPFVSSSGARLMYPGDPRGGSAETINCRCFIEVDVDFLAGIK